MDTRPVGPPPALDLFAALDRWEPTAEWALAHQFALVLIIATGASIAWALVLVAMGVV